MVIFSCNFKANKEGQMKKIGFIDNFLSEWHANSYPAMIRNHAVARDLGLDVCYAYSKTEISPYDNVSTDEWCAKHNVQRCATIEELVDKSDYIVVLSPDNPELHEELSDYALRSGKPTFIDKTFAENKESAIRMFELAKRYNTPMFSTSSLRFADEIKPYRLGNTPAFSNITVGCYKFEIYAIHIFEIMCAVMKGGAKRLMSVQNSRNRNIIVDYGGGRYATYIQMDTDDPYGVPFITSIEMPDKSAHYFTIKDGYQQNFINALIEFFATGISPVDSAETIDLMGMLDSAKKALQSPFEWIKI